MSTYTTTVERNLKGVEHFSVGPCAGCSECGLEGITDTDPCALDAYEAAAEASFSWAACESCGSTFGGNRFPAHGYITFDVPLQAEERRHFRVCTDCAVYHANGEQPEDWRQHPRNLMHGPGSRSGMTAHFRHED